MDHITVRHIVEAVSGTLLCGDADTELKHISIDSRSMRGADLFVPLIGEKSDAHRFLVQAMDNGAAAALTSEHEAAPEGFHGALIQVKDTKLALQTIGRCLRARLSIPLVGITGSVGKTTTREMVAAALSAKYKTFKTPANHNSQIGVPLTISEISENDEIGVLELGMSEPGEMAVIAEIAAVDSAVMTNIGVTHIENLGSRENILKEKLHIQDGMKAGGILFVNGDNDMLSTVHAKAGCHTVRYGLGADNDYRAEDLSYLDGFPSFTMVHGEVRVPVKLTVMGEHNVMNALAALAVADAYDVPLADAAEKLLEFGGFKNRQQIYHKNGYTIVDDTYNASPDSMKAAIGVLSSLPAGRRIAVLADMKELLDLQRFYIESEKEPGENSDQIKNLDSRFHELLYTSCGSRPFADTLISLHKKIIKYRKASVTHHSRAVHALEEHTAIYEALAAHDGDKAAEAALLHVTNARANIADITQKEE